MLQYVQIAVPADAEGVYKHLKEKSLVDYDLAVNRLKNRQLPDCVGAIRIHPAASASSFSSLSSSQNILPGPASWA